MRHLYRLAILYVMIAGCQSASKPTEQVATLEEIAPIRPFYCSLISEDLYHHRCDELTFQNLEAAFCDPGPDMSGHEIEPGKWTRDEKACYPDDSRSQCSGDGLITMTAKWISWGNSEALLEAERTIAYLENNDWICGVGYTGYTNVKHLKWLLTTVKNWLEDRLGLLEPGEIRIARTSGVSSNDSGGTIKLTEDDDAVEGGRHNDYLVALHALSFGRIRGWVSDVSVELLRQLAKKNPESMIHQALYHSFADGDQQVALDLIRRDCPTDYLPDDQDWAGWGSSPLAIHCIVAIAILQGD